MKQHHIEKAINKIVTIAALSGIAWLLFGVCHAQTNTAVSNPFFSALNTIVIDTNSAFFANEKFQLRSALIENNTTAADFGGDINFNYIQLGGDIVSRGAANVVAEAGGDVAYRVIVHNMELDPLLGVSWSWDDNTAYLRGGMRLSYYLSGRSFAFVQPELRDDMASWGRPTAQIQIGIGFAF